MSEPPPRQRLLVLAVCCSALFLVSLDNTALNTALPAIQHDFGAFTAGLQWTVDSYLVVLSSLLLLAGSTGDRIGRRRIFRAGLVLFTTASLLCSLAPTLGWLIAFRALQAVGGCMLTPVAMAIITNVFTGRRERARAIGVWSAVQGITMAVGPLLGGLLVDTVGRRWIFLINLPVGLLALALTGRVPESRAPQPRRLDAAGQLLVVVLLATTVYAIIQGPAVGWTSAQVLVCAVTAAVALPALITVELVQREPLLELRFFRQPPFTASALSAVCAFAALSGFLFLAALDLQEARGLDAWQAGLYLLPMAAMTIACPPLAGHLTATRGPHLPLMLSGTATTLAGLLALLGAQQHTPLLLACYLLFGTGFGLVNAPITHTAVSGMPRTQAGVASAITTTSRQIGSALGVAAIGATLPAAGYATTTFDHASRPGWWIITGCGITIAALATLTRHHTTTRHSGNEDHPAPSAGPVTAPASPPHADGGAAATTASAPSWPPSATHPRRPTPARACSSPDAPPPNSADSPPVSAS
ncbi:MFS transporter [Streptomyces olivoreticuli]|uniref:MFS transporter n=1 Tax=Streptomyces olivoreticuli TaxID=68246 RepID=UPI001967B28D|nr:MFS transporter [Streptomyces olivoreticuli]